MRRLKELRQAKNLTQTQLAHKIGTTQQSVARWESGRTTPSVLTLNALAQALGSTVAYLLGQQSKASSLETEAQVEDSDEESWFWGHLGLLLPAADQSLWYPISESTRNRLWTVLRNLDTDDAQSEWIVCETLNNRMLAFMPDQLHRIWLLDDACDGPDGDWNPKFVLDDYAGLPAETYKAMDAWLDREWEITSADEVGDLKFIEEILEKSGLLDAEKLNKYLHYSYLYYSSGRKIQHHVEPEDLWQAITDLEMGFNRTIYLPGSFGDNESFVPLKNLCLLDASLIDAVEGHEKAMAEFDKVAQK